MRMSRSNPHILARLRAALFCLVASMVPAAAHARGAAIATKRAEILRFISDLQKQHKTLTGVQVNEYEVYLDCTSQDRLFDMTGTRPAILGLELMNVIAQPPYASYLVRRAVAQTASGGLVTMSWHERNPVEVCARGEFFDCVKKPMSAETLKALLTPGTREHQLWLADVDAIAKVLNALQSKGVVVLFRPYHEMNGGWFWWGKQNAYPELWDALHDELVGRDKLNNLIWIWSADRDVPDASRYFPRRNKPDVVGIDVYEDDPDSSKYTDGHSNVKQAGGTVPFALSEVGFLPSRKTVDAINPAWALLWGGEFLNGAWAYPNSCDACNRPARVAAFMREDRMVPLDKMPVNIRALVSAGFVNRRPAPSATPVCKEKVN